MFTSSVYANMETRFRIQSCHRLLLWWLMMLFHVWARHIMTRQDGLAGQFLLSRINWRPRAAICNRKLRKPSGQRVTGHHQFHQRQILLLVLPYQRQHLPCIVRPSPAHLPLLEYQRPLSSTLQILLRLTKTWTRLGASWLKIPHSTLLWKLTQIRLPQSALTMVASQTSRDG